MSVFKGEPTAIWSERDATVPEPRFLASKYVWTRERLEWVTPDPDSGRPSYHLYVQRHPWRGPTTGYRVVASMGANDSMQRILPTLEKARAVFDRVNHWTMRTTLYNQGFRRW